MDSQNEGRKSNSSGNLNFVVASLVIFFSLKFIRVYSLVNILL